MNAQQVHVTVDFQPEVEALRTLADISQSPIAQDTNVRTMLTKAMGQLAKLVGEKSLKQTQILEASQVPGPLSPERLGGKS